MELRPDVNEGMQHRTRRLMQEKTENQSWDQPRAGEPVGVRRRVITRSAHHCSLVFIVFCLPPPPEIPPASRLHPAHPVMKCPPFPCGSGAD